MPFQLLPQQQPGFGASFGTGLGSGIAYLAEQKLNQITKGHEIKQAAQFWKGLGLPDQQAMQFASAPKEVQKSLLDRLEGVNVGGQVGQSQVTGQTAPQPGGVTIGANPAERRHKETLQQQRIQHIEKMNAPIIKATEEAAVPANQLVKLSNQGLELLKTGKAITGAAGRITPEFLQSDEGQQLVSVLKQIVLIKSQLGKGVPSRLRLALEEGAKAQIWQQPKVIEKLLSENIKDPEVQKAIAGDEALQKILLEGSQPENLKSALAKSTHEILKQKTKPQTNEFTELPPAAQFDGKIAKNPATGQRMKSVNGQWVPIKEGM
jgi:hypothetical protein